MSGMAVTAFLAEKIKNVRIAVIGDVMLDRYFHGEVKRISPEAPVPVTRVTKIKSVLGGAANVAANLAHLDCQVFMGGVTGDDENRVLLEKMMADAGIDASGLVKSEARSTITKLRVLGGQQQMLRLDFEEVGDLLPPETEALTAWLDGLLAEGLDGIIVSDYAKGVCAAEFVQSVIAKAYAQIHKKGHLSLFKSTEENLSDGEQKRDFVYVKDCASIMFWLLENPSITGIHNVGTGFARTFNDLAKILFSALDMKMIIDYFDMPKEMVEHVLFPLSKFETKGEIREIARKNELKVANKPDSEDICFIPDGNYKKFLEDNSDNTSTASKIATNVSKSNVGFIV